MTERKFIGGKEILGFYDIDDVAYVCTLYYGDRYFRLRVFDLDWNEVQYLVVGQSRSGLRFNPSCSPRFFQSFKVKFDASKV